MDQLPDFLTLSQMSDQDLTKLFGTRDFFIYEADVGTLVHAGGTGQVTFTIQSDSNFLWQEGCFWATITNATETDSTRVIPNITATILDTGSGRQLSSGSVPIGAQFGYGSEPFILPTPRFFRAQSQITVSCINFDATVDYYLRLQFIGTKFFKFAQSI